MSVLDGTATSLAWTGAVSPGAAVSTVLDAGHNAMVIGVFIPNGGFTTDISSIVRDGVSFTRIGSITDNSNGSIDVWGGIGLTPGTSNATIISGHAFAFKGVAISFQNVSSWGTALSTDSNSDLNNATVATTSGGYLLGIGVAESSSTLTPQNSQTQLFDSLFGGTNRVHAGKQTAGGTSTQDRYTISAAGALVSFQINATATGTTVTPSGFGMTLTLNSAITLQADTTLALATGFGLTLGLGTPTVNIGTPSNVTVMPNGFGLTLSLGLPSVAINNIVIGPVGFGLVLTLGLPSIVFSFGHKRTFPIAVLRKRMGR